MLREDGDYIQNIITGFQSSESKDAISNLRQAVDLVLPFMDAYLAPYKDLAFNIYYNQG